MKCRDYATNIIDKVGIFNADPTLFFMRGKCLFELNILTDALSDLNHAISSDNFDQSFLKEAYAIRGRLYLRMGMIFDAEVEAQKSSNLTLINDIKEAKELYSAIQKHVKKNKVEEAMLEYKDLFNTCDYSADLLAEASKFALDNDLEDAFQELSTRAFQIDSNSLKILELRGKYFLCHDDYEYAKRHLVLCAKKSIGIGNCMSLNRQNNEFKNSYEKFELAVNHSNAEEANLYGNKCLNIALKNCKNGSKLFLKSQAMISHSISMNGNKTGAISYLDSLIEKYPKSIALLLERGYLKHSLGDTEGAALDYQEVKKLDPKNEKDKYCDYYKLLNLSKDFTKSQLKNALRKAFKVYHPDQFSDPIQKKEAEKKMVQVNRASVILSDPQKKALYDRGLDPDNPHYVAGEKKGQQNEYNYQEQGGIHFVDPDGAPFNFIYNGQEFGFHG